VSHHPILITYGPRAISPGVDIGSFSGTTVPGVGLDGSVFLGIGSNDAERYLISDRSSTAEETYDKTSWGFITLGFANQRPYSPQTTCFWNFGGEFGYFEESGSGTWQEITGSGIRGGSGIIWTGSDTGYAIGDSTSSARINTFDFSDDTYANVYAGATGRFFVKDLNPGTKLYYVYSSGTIIGYLDTADDSLNDLITGISPALNNNPRDNAVIASDGFLYTCSYNSGTTTGYLEKRGLSDGVIDSSRDVGNNFITYLDESPTDGRLWAKIGAQFEGIRKDTLETDVLTYDANAGNRYMLGFTDTGLLVLSNSEAGATRRYYYTIAT